MDLRDRERRGAALAGGVLVIVGIAALVVQQSGIEVGWPAWIIVPGVAIFLVAIAVGRQTGAGFAALGGIVTAVGLVLAVQDATHTYASWAYAWALVAPGGVGAGLFLYGLLTVQWDTARGGLGALVAGVAIFLVGYLFFEGLIGLNGRPSGDVAKFGVPAALVALGLLVIVGAFLPARWRGGSYRWGDPHGWNTAFPAGPASSAGPASGPASSAGPASGPGPAPGATSWTAPGPTGGPGGLAGGPGGPDTPPGSTDPSHPDARAIELGGVQSAEVMLTFGAGHLVIVGPAAPGHLVDGTFVGGVQRQDRGPGSVRLSTPGEAFWGRVWSGSPFDWRVGLTAEVPLRLALEMGAARAEADLSALRVTDLRVRTGAAETDLLLPAAAGQTHVEVDAGAAAVRLRVPAGVAARIRSNVALGTTDVDTTRFPRDPLGGWASADYPTAANRVDIEARGGVGSIAIR